MYIHKNHIPAQIAELKPIEKPCGDDFVIIIGGLHIEMAGLKMTNASMATMSPHLLW